jgi:uncharacterized membrane protein YqaE (UPF0057 family)
MNRKMLPAGSPGLDFAPIYYAMPCIVQRTDSKRCYVARGTTIAASSLPRSLIYCCAERNIMDVLRILLSILLPPVGVFLQVGIGLHFWLNILLTLLGYIPGIIHAVWIILKR